nr:MAG TPA: hypothetical protein [Caudoviricetes sp.]DAL03672.1 MAG TPA: hypothetical protein [Caudoviricetes sp.]
MIASFITYMVIFAYQIYRTRRCSSNKDNFRIGAMEN